MTTKLLTYESKFLEREAEKKANKPAIFGTRILSKLRDAIIKQDYVKYSDEMTDFSTFSREELLEKVTDMIIMVDRLV